MKNRWTGLIARVGVETEDQRVVHIFKTDLRRGTCPLLDNRGSLSEAVGTVDAVGFGQFGDVYGSGRTSLEPGTYKVGMSLDQVDSGMNEDGEGLVTTIGRFIGLSVIEAPAWPDCEIVVKAGGES